MERSLDTTAGFLFGCISAWLIVVVGHASGYAQMDIRTEIGESKKPPTVSEDKRMTTFTGQEVYYEFYRGLVLPTVTGAALIGVLQHSLDIFRLEWWCGVFFVLYYSSEFTRIEEPLDYKKRDFYADLAGIAVFSIVTIRIGLFDRRMVDAPSWVFGGILTIPVLALVSRVLNSKQPRMGPTIIGVAAASLGLLGTYVAWPLTFAEVMMFVLLVTLLRYLACNLASNGWRDKGAHTQRCRWCS